MLKERELRSQAESEIEKERELRRAAEEERERESEARGMAVGELERERLERIEAQSSIEKEKERCLSLERQSTEVRTRDTRCNHNSVIECSSLYVCPRVHNMPRDSL